MAEIPYPRSFVAAQEELLRELEDECRALRGARTMNLAHLRAAVQGFVRQVKDEGASVERALALLRACLRSSGLDITDAARRDELQDKSFEWAMDVYYGSGQRRPS